METFHGSRVYDGVAVGRIVYVSPLEEIEDQKGEGYDKEKARFEVARKAAMAKLDELLKNPQSKIKKEDSDILEAHKLMLDDQDFLDVAETALKHNYSAEKAAKDAGEEIASRLEALSDPYLRSRAQDARDIATGIINELMGRRGIVLSEPSILVSDSISAADLLKLDRDFVLGLVLLKTSSNAHVSIIARTLEIPTICSVKENFPSKEDGMMGAMDAGAGLFFAECDAQTIVSLLKKKKTLDAKKESLLKTAFEPAITVDGIRVKVNANISASREAATALKNGADGIGLFRSEFVYLSASSFPSEEDQFKEYQAAVKTMGDKPTVIRTFDIGADKKASYFHLPKEANPALGYRSIRICEDRQDIFLTQLKALYRASNYGNLSIMIPMIISPEEVDFVHNMCSLAKENLRSRGIPFRKVKVGIMIETPAAAVIADILAKKVDFFSIGTNDLSQYTLAIDRQNKNVDKFFNPRHKAILRLIKRTVDEGHKAGIPVGICGELARDPALTGFFIKIGVDELSVSSPYLLSFKESIRHLDTSKTDVDALMN